MFEARVMRRLFAAVRAQLRLYTHEDPLLTRWVLIYAVLQLTAIGWDLPCMYGWENDGVAPRDLFGGLAFNLTPGNGHRYPLLHYALLALLAWPVVLVAALRARSFQLQDLMQSVLSDATLTGIALIAKLLAVVLGCLGLLALGRSVRRSVDPLAARFAVAFAALNLSIAYYGRVSNLDGPYMCWVMLSLDRVLDVFERGEARDYRAAALYAAAAVATKDQAYSVYLLSLPLYLVIWPWLARAGSFPVSRAEHWRRLLSGAGAGLLGYAAMSGALFNPTGFVHRLGLLTGSNSQDWRRYERSITGVLANLSDLWHAQAEFFWPWPLVALAWIGCIKLALPAGARASRLQRPLPRALALVCALSSLITFTLPVARCEHRFVLPFAFALSIGAGAAAATISRAWSRALTLPLLAAAFVLCGARIFALELTQWRDARFEVEAFLDRLPRGSVVETYGLGVYLPRFDRSPSASYQVQRVAPAPPPDKRPPIPGMREIQAPYGEVAARAPDVLVITEGFGTRFLPEARGAGHITSPETEEIRRDLDAQQFFARALHDELPGYRHVLVADTSLPAWASALGMTPVRIHGSTASKTWLLAKRAR